jgi:hypothetical protein
LRQPLIIFPFAFNYFFPGSFGANLLSRQIFMLNTLADRNSLFFIVNMNCQVPVSQHLQQSSSSLNNLAAKASIKTAFGELRFMMPSSSKHAFKDFRQVQR